MAAAGLRVVVEDRVGDGDHARPLRQAPAEGQAVLLAEGGEKDVRALGLEDLEARRRQPVGADAALGPQVLAEAGEVVVR